VASDGVKITRKDGLTPEEGALSDVLVIACSIWGRLPKQHPDDDRYFTDSIHRIQDLLTTRIARREYPDGWPDKGRVGTDAT